MSNKRAYENFTRKLPYKRRQLVSYDIQKQPLGSISLELQTCASGDFLQLLTATLRRLWARPISAAVKSSPSLKATIMRGVTFLLFTNARSDAASNLAVK
jgi:hypothetical protein